MKSLYNSVDISVDKLTYFSVRKFIDESTIFTTHKRVHSLFVINVIAPISDSVWYSVYDSINLKVTSLTMKCKRQS